MDSSEIMTELIEKSRLSKSELSRRSGVSRSLIDDYVKGRVQPSVGQLSRLAEASGQRLDISLTPLPQIPEEFVAVLEFGDLFPRKEPKPLVNLREVWQHARELT